MNFLKTLASYITADAGPFEQQIRRKESSEIFEVLDQDEDFQSLALSQASEIIREPTKYYMLQNEFFNNVIVQKDQRLKTFDLEQWDIILKNKSLKGVCQKNIIFSILKGIPNSVRKQFWSILADVETMKQKFPVDYYDLLQKTECSSKSIIEKDVPRTKVDEKNRQKLFNILIAYSNIDPNGYTQGMNLIAGSLLNILGSIQDCQDPDLQIDQIGFEQKVFWVFVGIMYSKNWRQCFQGMKGVQRMLVELQQLMSQHTPQILWHIKQHDLDLNMCFAQYYLTLVIYNTPIEFATTILDLFLLQGQIVIHSVILKMIMACRQKILQIDQMGILVKFFKTDILKYCHQQTQKQCKKAQSLEDFIINFFTLTPP